MSWPPAGLWGNGHSAGEGPCGLPARPAEEGRHEHPENAEQRHQSVGDGHPLQRDEEERVFPAVLDLLPGLRSTVIRVLPGASLRSTITQNTAPTIPVIREREREWPVPVRATAGGTNAMSGNTTSGKSPRPPKPCQKTTTMCTSADGRLHNSPLGRGSLAAWVCAGGWPGQGWPGTKGGPIGLTEE